MALREEIADWDRRTVWVLRDVYKRFHRNLDFLDCIIALMNEEPLQNGATWLLKAHLANHPQILSDDQIDTIYKLLPCLNGWQSKLHVLQIMSHMPVPETRLKETEKFLREAMLSDVKFVRAWAFDGYHQLAMQYPQLRKDAESLFSHAIENDSASSVKSRLHHIIKAGFPNPEPSAAD